MLRGPIIVLATLLVVGSAASCTGDDESVLDVFAAASLTDAFTELADEFEAANPDIGVRLNFAGSSTLREQLLDGAEADVFASANMAIMDELVMAGAIEGSPRVAARNTIMLAVPTLNPAGVSGLADLADPDLLVGLCERGVPCGDLAQQLLDEAGVVASPDTLEPDVRSLARRLADRELDVALIYVSDIVADKDRLWAIQLGGAMPASDYPVAAIDSDPDADAFVDFVLGPSGRAVLQRWGFDTP